MWSTVAYLQWFSDGTATDRSMHVLKVLVTKGAVADSEQL